MIKLKYHSGYEYWLSEKKIEKLERRSDIDATDIIMESGNTYQCKETPEEIAQLTRSAQGIKDHSKCSCEVVLGGPPLGGGLLSGPPQVL